MSKIDYLPPERGETNDDPEVTGPIERIDAPLPYGEQPAKLLVFDGQEDYWQRPADTYPVPGALQEMDRAHRFMGGIGISAVAAVGAGLAAVTILAGTVGPKYIPGLKEAPRTPVTSEDAPKSGAISPLENTISPIEAKHTTPLELSNPQTPDAVPSLVTTSPNTFVPLRIEDTPETLSESLTTTTEDQPSSPSTTSEPTPSSTTETPSSDTSPPDSTTPLPE